MSAIQQALDDIVNHKKCPSSEVVVKIIEEIDNDVVTKAQLGGLITGLIILAKKNPKRRLKI